MTEKKKSLPLSFLIILALIGGIVVAIIAARAGFSWFLVDWVMPFGDIFIRLLTLIAVPLVLFSIIQGIGNLKASANLGRLAAKTVVLYILTTVIAISLGLVLVNLVKPGKSIDEAQRLENRFSYEIWTKEAGFEKTVDGKSFISDPKNQEALQAYLSHNADSNKLSMDSTKQVAVSDFKDLVDVAKEKQQEGPLAFLVNMVPSNAFQSLGDNKRLLQVIVFAIFFGVALLAINKDKAEPVKRVVDGLNEVFLKMITIILKGAPFFAFALMAGSIAKAAGDDPNKISEILKSLGIYAVTLVVGLAFMAFIFYPIMVHLIAKIKALKFIKKIGKAQAFAFSTSSSAATLPVTMEVTEKDLGASKEITSFVLPIGATVNMDGTSMYQAIAVVFLCQFHMIDLDIGQQLMIVLLATMSSIGSAAVPSAGLAMLMVVLISLNLNPYWVALIYPIDRILDMCRTVVNVTGDAAVTAIVAKTEGQLRKEDETKSAD